MFFRIYRCFSVSVILTAFNFRVGNYILAGACLLSVGICTAFLSFLFFEGE